MCAGLLLSVQLPATSAIRIRSDTVLTFTGFVFSARIRPVASLLTYRAVVLLQLLPLLQRSGERGRRLFKFGAVVGHASINPAPLFSRPRFRASLLDSSSPLASLVPTLGLRSSRCLQYRLLYLVTSLLCLERTTRMYRMYYLPCSARTPQSELTHEPTTSASPITCSAFDRTTVSWLQSVLVAPQLIPHGLVISATCRRVRELLMPLQAFQRLRPLLQ